MKTSLLLLFLGLVSCSEPIKPYHKSDFEEQEIVNQEKFEIVEGTNVWIFTRYGDGYSVTYKKKID